MARRLPPLKTLPDFEAAARHLSFTKAAEELYVTHGAVSRQVKSLEDFLGVRLFRRLNRALRLTDEGQAYVAAVRELLEGLADATERVRKRDEQGALVVSTTMSFTIKWLVPRLARFREQHPEIDVRLQAEDRLIDFARDGVDIGIRYGRGQYPGLKSERLTHDDFVPICSPALVKGEHPLRTPSDLKHYDLIHEMGTQIDWRMWLMAAGAEEIDWTRGPVYSHSSFVIQAVINGEGVALGRTALISDDLAAGRLVIPFDIPLKAEYAYYITYLPRALARAKVRAFRDWLLEEAAKDHAPAPAQVRRS